MSIVVAVALVVIVALSILGALGWWMDASASRNEEPDRNVQEKTL